MRNRKRSIASARPHYFAEPLEARIALAVFTVMNVGDNGAGSLRQAIIDANNALGADTIVFDAPFQASPHTITFLTASPQINQQLTITGPGASLLTVTRSGVVTPATHVFNSFATSLTMTGMTVTGGNVTADGGGLSISGVTPNVLLDGMIFTGNTSTGNGGAISLTNSSTLIVRNSVISNNTAGVLGGGIFFFQNGSLVIENSTISGNIANGTSGHDATGGGIYFDGTALASPPPGFMASTLLIKNSTFNNNNATHSGAGIAIDTFAGTLLVQNTTITGNTAGTSGGGISQNDGAGSILLQDSTVAGNTANGIAAGTGGGGVARVSTDLGSISLENSVVSGNNNSLAPDIRASAFTTTNANFSAIGNATGFTLSGSSGNNLGFGTNLMLGALASNGGPTQTMLPAASSPLINAGSNALVPVGITTDQRGAGFARISGASVDIGAVERDDIAPAVTASEFSYLTAPQSLRFTFSEDVGASLGTADLQLRNLTTSTDIQPANLSLSYFSTTNIAQFTFPGFPFNALPNGNYRATLVAAGIRDSSGNAMAANFVFNFFFLSADANHNKTVDTVDFGILAANFSRAGLDYGGGDFTYDTTVDTVDFGLLVANFSNSLPSSLPSSAPAIVRTELSTGTDPSGKTTTQLLLEDDPIDFAPGAV